MPLGGYRGLFDPYPQLRRSHTVTDSQCRLCSRTQYAMSYGVVILGLGLYGARYNVT